MQTQRKAPALGIKRGGRYADGVVPEPSIGGFLKDRAQAVINSLGGGQPATGSPANPVADAVTNNTGLVGKSVSASQSYNDRMSKAMGDYADGTPLVQGPGSTTSDSVPVNVSRDEAILPADTVKAIGADNLASIIQATHTPVKGKTGYGARRGGNYADGEVEKLPDFSQKGPVAITPMTALAPVQAPIATGAQLNQESIQGQINERPVNAGKDAVPGFIPDDRGGYQLGVKTDANSGLGTYGISRSPAPVAAGGQNNEPAAKPIPANNPTATGEPAPVTAPAGNTMQVSGNGHTFTGSGDVSGYSGEWQGGIGQHQGDGTKTAAAAPAWDALDAKYRAQDAGIQAQQDTASGKQGQHLEVPFGGGVSRVVDDTPAMTARLNPSANTAPTPPDMTSFPNTFAGRIQAQRAQQNYAQQEGQYKMQAEIGVNRAKVANEQQNVQSESGLRAQQATEQASKAAKDQQATELQKQINAEQLSASPDKAKIKRLQGDQYALVGRTQQKVQVQSDEGTDANGQHYKKSYIVDDEGNARPMVPENNQTAQTNQKRVGTISTVAGKSARWDGQQWVPVK